MNQDLYNHGINGPAVVINPATPWVRNPEWLEMPVVSPTESKIVILQRISPLESNFVAFNTGVTGGYTVDWGDGEITDYPSYVVSLKEYNFDTVTTGLTSDGYKQVLITITPTIPGNTFSSNVNLAQKHTLAGGSYNQGYLDIIISVPGTTSGLTLGASSTAVVSLPYLERVQLIASALTSYNSLFGDCTGLQSVSVASSATVTNMSYMFQNCISLQTAPSELPYETCTTLASMFSRCYRLRSLSRPIITTVATSTTSMFANCLMLSAAPEFVFTTTGSVDCTAMFSFCIKLVYVPTATWEKVSNMGSTFSNCIAIERVGDMNLIKCTSLGSTFTTCRSLLSVGTLTTSNLLTNLSSTFVNCQKLVVAPIITNTTAVNTMASFASNCSSLVSCPPYDTPSVTTFAAAFTNCYVLVNVPEFNYSKCTTITSMFGGCSSLVKSGPMNFGTTTTGALTAASVFQFSNAFESTVQHIGPITFPSTATSVTLTGFALNCRNLRSISLDCTKVATTGGISNVLAGANSYVNVILTGLRFGAVNLNGSLQVPALVALFESLGTASGAQTITVSGNPGWSSLTAADKLIATSKGWTLA